MHISQNQTITNDLCSRIQSAKNGRMVRSDHSEMAAQHLKTPEDLSAFYGQDNGTEPNAVVATVAYMVSVAVGALTFAAAFTIGGHETHLGDTAPNWDIDVTNFSIEELLIARRDLLL